MRNRSYTILALAVLAFAGCSKVEELNNNPDSALQIESVGGVSQYALMQAQPASKAVIDGNTLPGSEATQGIGIFVTAQDGSAYDGHDKGYSNVKYSFDSGKWSTATPIYLSNTVGKLYGYFPYSEAANELTAIPVASSLNGTDYLYAAPNDVSYSQKSVSLQMNHALARFHLTIKKGDKYLKDCELSKIAIESNAIAATGTMNITTGAVAGVKTEGTIGSVVFDGDGVTGTVTKEGIEKDILLVPADNTIGKKDLTLTLTIDGSDAKIKFSEEGGLDIRSGIQCNATIEIQDSGIKVIGVGVGLWGEGGSQTVQVNGHTVTVKLSDDVTPHDILTDIYVDGDNVIIRASSFQGRGLACNVGDNAKCERSFTNDKFTFIISEICSNIEAVLGYAPPVTLNVQSDSNGKAWIGDDDSKTSGQFDTGQQVVIHALPNDKFRFFRWNDNNRETSRTVTVGVEDITYSASFISSDLIPSLFTVNSNGKQVLFSNGNLYWDGSKYCLENTQYYTKSGLEPENHIAHFYWSKSADVARSLSYYSDTGTPGDIFFANNPGSFKANEHTGWSVLTGGTNGEWKFLIDRKDSEGNALYNLGVKVCGSANCLILLPDDWKWGENGVGTVWQNEYSESTTVKWSTMENAGAVCLPAADFRNGDPECPDPASVGNVGNNGNYWSASLYSDHNAYDLDFYGGNVHPSNSSNRNQAYSVRLVTEYQSEPSVE